MPQIPVFEAQPDAPTVRLPGADPGAFAAVGQAAEGAGSQLGGFGQEWSQRYAAARQQSDAANISAGAIQKADALRLQFSQIPDHQKALDGFNGAYTKLQQDTLKQTDDPVVQSYVTQRMAQTGEIYGSQVGQESFRREGAGRLAQTEQHGIDAQNRIAANPDPTARAHEIDGMMAELQGNVAAGWMSATEAQAQATQFKFKISQDDVMRDAAKSPALTYATLSDPAKRAVAYPYLPPEWADHYALRLEGRAKAEEGRALGTAALGGMLAPSTGGGGGNGGGGAVGTPGDIGVPDSYAPMVNSAVSGTAVPARLVSAVAQRESGWNPSLTGTAGEIGLGQIKPGTAAQPGYGVAPADPATLTNPQANLSFTARYLDGLGKHFGVTDWGNADQVRPVLEAYNGSSHKQDYAGEVMTIAGMTPGKAPAEAPDEDAAIRRVLASTNDPTTQSVAIAAIRKGVSQWRAATEADRKQLDYQIGDLRDALTQGVDADIPVARIRALLPPEQARETLQDLGVRQVMGTMTSGLRYASPDEVAATVNSLDSGMGAAAATLNLRLQKLGIDAPPPGTDASTTAAFHVRQQMLTVARQVLAARSDGLANDPAGYVAAEPTVAAARAAIDDKDPATFAAYARTTQAVQQRMGVAEGDTRVLAAGQARQLAGKLLATDPATGDAGGAIDGMAKSYGDAWPAVWHDVVRDGKLPADWQVLGSMPPGADRMALQRALQATAAKGGGDALRQEIDPAQAQVIDRNLDAQLSDFRNTVMIPQLQGDVGVLSAVRGAAKQLAYWKVLNGQTDGNAAVQDAVAAVTPYDIEGRARAPKGQGALASSVAAAMQAGLTGDALASAGGGWAGLRDSDRQQQYAAAAKKKGAWVTNERGDGWTLAVPDPNGRWQFPLDTAGQRIGFRFADMAKLPQQSETMPDGP